MPVYSCIVLKWKQILSKWETDALEKFAYHRMQIHVYLWQIGWKLYEYTGNVHAQQNPLHRRMGELIHQEYRDGFNIDSKMCMCVEDHFTLWGPRELGSHNYSKVRGYVSIGEVYGNQSRKIITKIICRSV